MRRSGRPPAPTCSPAVTGTCWNSSSKIRRHRYTDCASLWTSSASAKPTTARTSKRTPAGAGDVSRRPHSSSVFSSHRTPPLLRQLPVRLAVQSRSIPDEAEVVAEWARLVRAQQTQFAAQLDPLSPNQVAFLHALARNPTEQVQSQEFLAQAGLASSSAAKVRRDLARSDLIGSGRMAGCTSSTPECATICSRNAPCGFPASSECNRTHEAIARSGRASLSRADVHLRTAHRRVDEIQTRE